MIFQAINSCNVHKSFNFFSSIFLSLILFPLLARGEFLIEKIWDQGRDENRMVWIIMGDGYTALEMDGFHKDVSVIIDKIFNTPPWNLYKQFINVYRIDVVSNESGADHPSNNIYVDTALDATYDTYGISRLLTINDAKAFDIASTVPLFDAVMVVVNDPKYGGSGGATIVFSNHEKSGLIALHEAGHLIGGLADEYETPYPGYPEGDSEPNVTFHTELDYIPWKNWIVSGTPLPTPEDMGNYGVGLYEGARYLSHGIYRPYHNCIMRSLGVPFCPICSETLVLAIYNFVDLIDAFHPNSSNIFLSSSFDKLKFSIDLVDPSSKTAVVVWELDGIVQDNANRTSLEIDFATLKKGAHRLAVLAGDVTPLVRNDPQGLMLSYKSWNVNKDAASGTISGRVVNSVNHRGIKGVLVEIVDGGCKTTTDSEGKFVLSPVSEGTHRVIIKDEKYVSTSDNIATVVDGEVTNVEIMLNPLFETYTISGNFTGVGDKEGIVLYLMNDNEIVLSTFTEEDGSYLFNGVENGSYIVMPIATNFEINPPIYVVEVNGNDLNNINFEMYSSPCPVEVLFEKQPSSITLLRKFRDNVLNPNKIGRYYTKLYYQHANELRSLIMAHEDIRTNCHKLLMELVTFISLINDGGKITVGDEILYNINLTITSIESHASSQLKNTIRSIKKDIKDEKLLPQFGIVVK